jgi:hypothetical protein
MRASARTRVTFVSAKVTKTIRSGTPSFGSPAFLSKAGAKRTRDLQSLKHLFAFSGFPCGTRWCPVAVGALFRLFAGAPRGLGSHRCSFTGILLFLSSQNLLGKVWRSRGSDCHSRSWRPFQAFRRSPHRGRIIRREGSAPAGVPAPGSCFFCHREPCMARCGDP